LFGGISLAPCSECRYIPPNKKLLFFEKKDKICNVWQKIILKKNNKNKNHFANHQKDISLQNISKLSNELNGKKEP